LLPFENRLERVARLGDVREVELRLQIVFRRASPRSGPLPTISAALAEMRLYLLRLFHADGTGVGFLFYNSDRVENVQDGPALDLQFSRQIVDSNLIYHPPSIFLPQTR
jgi:hypothetical protein